MGQKIGLLLEVEHVMNKLMSYIKDVRAAERIKIIGHFKSR